jgi:hypothetical protein
MKTDHLSLHPALPRTFTPENLAQWITENCAEKREHEEKLELTPEAKATFEHKASLAACKIQELKEVENEFKAFLKKGTPVDINQMNEEVDKVVRIPQTITIPPTAGLEELTANLNYATTQLRNGFTVDKSLIFLIPFPEEKMMIAVDIEGKEFEQYHREFTEPEKLNYEKPILDEVKKNTRKKTAEPLDL